MYKNIFNNTTKLFQESALMDGGLRDGEELDVVYALSCACHPDCSYILLEEKLGDGYKYENGDFVPVTHNIERTQTTTEE